MYSTNATSRHSQEATNGRTAISGGTAIRPIVIAFGRFTARGADVWRESPEGSRERLEYELAHRLERIEYAISGHRNGFEVRGALDPLSGWQLLHEHLAGV